MSRIPTPASSTPSPGGTERLPKVRSRSSRTSPTPTLNFPRLRQHQGPQTLQTYLQDDPLPHKDPRNVSQLQPSTHRTTPEQAKIYLGNHFRANAHLTDLHEIDYKIETGYEMLHDAEWHYTQTGYLYKYLMSPKGILNDQGLNRYDDYRAEKVNRK